MSKEKIPMNITIIGHTGSGKTSVTERLINIRTMDNIEKEAIDISRVSLNTFETVNYDVTIISGSSHRDLIKSGLTCPSQADCAVLIVSAGMDEFESGISKEGHTREHVLLAYTTSIKQLIITVNKMDVEGVSYSEDRFNRIKADVSIFIQKVGYNPEHVAFVPISARRGDNLIEVSEKMPWFTGWTLKREKDIITGKTLLEALDTIILPRPAIKKPLRLPIQDVYKIRGIGTVLAGQVETGVLKPNMIVKFAPSNLTATVESIEMHQTAVKEALPGDSVGFKVNNINVRELRRGFVCSDAQNEPARETTSFTAQVTVLYHPSQIIQGYTALMSCHKARVPCRFDELLEKIDRRTGKTIEASPKFIKSGDTAIIKMIPMKPICVETFKDYPSLGRFVIFDMNQTVAVGIIKGVGKISVASEDQAASARQ